MTVVYIIAAFILGGCCGVVLASVLAAAGRADLEAEFRELLKDGRPPAA